MTDCYYLRYDGNSAHPALLRIPGEVWMHPDEAGRILAPHVAGSCGVWCGSRHVIEKAELRRRLSHVVDHACSPEFEANVEERGRRFKEVVRRVIDEQDVMLRGLVDDPPMMRLRVDLDRRGLPHGRVAEHTGVDLRGFFAGRVRIDAEGALRLAAATGIHAGSWLWAQASADLDEASANAHDLPAPMVTSEP